jgi:uncharacterized membrane protein YraQ (UPF0718 family)
MLKNLSDYLTYNLLELERGTHLAEALNFFVYDTIKIFILLSVIIFSISVIRSYFPPEKTRRILSNKKLFIGNILAASLGVVTPFCSCSAVPLFIGFVEAGVPLGVTFSFLISSPMVNEVAVVLLFGLFGWQVAGLYVATGVLMAIVAGLVIGRLRLERFVEPYVWETHAGEAEVEEPTWPERRAYAKDYTQQLLKRVAPWVLIGIALAAGIHGYVPVELVARVAGKGNPFAVPVAVLIGIPLYSNAAGTIPIVHALVEKGVPIGTALALMMSVVAISVPEMLILRQVVKWPLLAVFAGVVTAAIIVVGYLLNAVVPT